MDASGCHDRIVVVGGGIAGLATALHLAPLPVTVIVGSPLGQQASTALAQGGIAAALGADDRPFLHAADTLQAGAGLSERAVAERVAEAAPGCIEWLIALGAPFDRAGSGALALGLEAAHSRRRIVHAGGDRTGRQVLDTLIRAARSTPSIEILQNTRVIDLALDENGAVAGVSCEPHGPAGTGGPTLVAARAVVLATGGVGGLYASTTNPLGSTGGGLALAARAGAILRDLEFVQFHPTAMAAGLDPMPLATEALRGEGAILVNSRGERFMEACPGAELAPRDVVAHAIFAQIGSGERVYLDTREALGSRIEQGFPGVTELCRRAGIDPVRDPIPVRPAAHYHMGGIKVDERGRSSVEGVWACGEVASTGLHGANRLASNSLVEALAYGGWIAADLKGLAAKHAPHRNSLHRSSQRDGPEAGGFASLNPDSLRALMDSHVGVLRDAGRLEEAIGHLRATALAERGIGGMPLRDAALVGLLVAMSAHGRRESRGAHQRSDVLGLAPAQHTELTLDQALHLADRVEHRARLPARESCMRTFEARKPTALPRVLIEPVVRNALIEDFGRAGDITTDAVIPAGAVLRGAIVARESGIVAGTDAAALAFSLVDPAIAVTIERDDGSRVERGAPVIRLEGPARGILSAERVALNLLCRMSGIATATARLVDAIRPHGHARIACTRKTTPGLRALEKQAVRAGGGSNHRFGLDDAVLIKDNHIAIAGGVRAALERARAATGHLVKIEIEVDTLEQLDEVLAIGADAILLDNMAPDTLKEAVRRVARRAITEASGRITAETAPAVAATGVDLISAGWITHSAPILDLGLDVE